MQRLLTVTLALCLGACAKSTPTCTDGLRNGLEADVDCGGPSCRRCAVGAACDLPEDCESLVCRLHVCAPAPDLTKCRRNADCPSGGCLDGSCVPLCAMPLVACGTGCVDPRFDTKNCGACGRVCLQNEQCEASTCQVRCPLGTMACDSGPNLVCVNAQLDVLHCGTCTTVCNPGQACKAGQCQPDCAPFQTPCGGQCVSTMTDLLNCGGCGLPCDPGEVCSNGLCEAACAPPVVVCDGGLTCVDIRFDPQNCGACGAPCPPPPNARRLCINMQCTRTACLPGFEDCNHLPVDGCEAELALDVMNCGMCGRACAPCFNGSCP